MLFLPQISCFSFAVIVRYCTDFLNKEINLDVTYIFCSYGASACVRNYLVLLCSEIKCSHLFLSVEG